MTTLAQMTSDVLAEASTYVRDQDVLTVLTSPLTDSGLTLNVDDATVLSRGVVEVGDELVYVKRTSPDDGEATVLPGTRGWHNTVAAEHDVHTIVRPDPVFPRVQVQRAINDTIKAVRLYALKSYDFTFDGHTLLNVLPADAADVTGVSCEVIDSTERWAILKTFRVDYNYQLDGERRLALELVEVPPAGRTVRVQYLGYPARISVGQDFSLTGLPDSSEDVIRLGALWRLLSTVDPGKVVATAPSADVMDAPVAAGKASDVSRYVYQLFSARLEEELRKQADLYQTVMQYQV